MPFGHDYLPTIQLLALPIIVALLWRIRIAGVRIPRMMLLTSAALAIAGFSFGISTRSIIPKRVVITRFSDDALGAKSRIFREQIEQHLELISQQRVLRYPKAVDSYQGVRSKFGDPRSYDAILWGKLDSFALHFPYRADQKKSAERQARMFGLRMVDQLPSIVLSKSADSGTVAFVSNVLGALQPAPLDAPYREAHREVLLKGALKIESRWRSQAHRALPAWMMANAALERAVDAGEFEAGEMRCALSNYTVASSVFKARDNAELATAIYNNWGVALAINGWITGNGRNIEDARVLFKRAIATKGLPNQFGGPERAWQAARFNLMLIDGKVGRNDRVPGREKHGKADKKKRAKQGRP